jgi:hypothetical protein
LCFYQRTTQLIAHHRSMADFFGYCRGSLRIDSGARILADPVARYRARPAAPPISTTSISTRWWRACLLREIGDVLHDICDGLLEPDEADAPPRR